MIDNFVNVRNITKKNNAFFLFLCIASIFSSLFDLAAADEPGFGLSVVLHRPNSKYIQEALQMSLVPSMRRFACLALLTASASCSLFAQRDAASLEGRVVDSSGAVVANASVAAVNTATNFTYHAQSDESGSWSISPVRIGTYTLTISAPGFKQSVVGPITLDVQQRQRADVTLQLGAVSEKVVVEGAAPLLETDSSETGQVIDSVSMVGFPLNGRNPVQLAQLSVGVTTSEPGARDSGGFGFSASGSRSSTTTSCSMESTTTPTCPTC